LLSFKRNLGEREELELAELSDLLEGVQLSESKDFVNQVESFQAKQLLLKTTIKARLSILILSTTYPTKVTSKHVRLLATGFVLPKSN
jgi:hypothetical protein